ncbi:hypothetical protein RFN29_27675 [Mesorhizobium sp. VK22B]|uniref:Tetratricopeptide repeat protein n=1 Tax=Mesorhizobium captivum TaxID=3072319 RepID=A0ABU4Z7U6_9HYPH|nr:MULTISPECIES: hypothetical protein [unclassified Mesorhizobium]MDX8495343.1 hypothetical protein [Mesorhizobium sp. VK22B]MDX8508747.1 hypothetical protein [Mesorhizobium sp. VK22E]
MSGSGSGCADSEQENSATEQEARRELERIFSDPEFHCPERNRKFLRFIAEELFQGRERSLKAYSIAVDVFGRAADFDASVDPIVRIEATRLRAALTRYYESHGQDHPIRIDLPRGRYVPQFSRKEAGAAVEAPAAPELRLSPVSDARSKSRLYPTMRAKSLSVAIGVASGLILGVLLIGFNSRLTSAPLISEKPSLSIEMRLAEGYSDANAEAFRDSLIVALSGFQSLRIRSPDAVTSSIPAEKGGVSQGSVIQNRYRLLLKSGADAKGPMLWWQVIDELTGETLRSGSEKSPKEMGPGTSAIQLASQFAVRLASRQGVVNTIETARELERPTLGNGCILRAILAIETNNETALLGARGCLEQTLKIRESDADAYAMLTGVLLKLEASGMTSELTDEAVSSADRAVALAPDSDRSYYAEMLAQFSIGNSEAAVQAGRRAMELNPSNPTTLAKLGRILFAAGRWDEGAELALKADQLNGLPFRDAETTLAFDAYRRGEFGEALLHLQHMKAIGCYSTQILKAATLGELGRMKEAGVVIGELRQSRPDFDKSLIADLTRLKLSPRLIDLIRLGLEKVGLKAA